jgi:tetratricopeptide (TPR) repeat protein
VRAEALRADTSFSSRLKENLLQATQLLEQAIARDPTFFLAYCRLAGTRSNLLFRKRSHAGAPRIGAHVSSALVCDLTPGEAHLALAEHLYRGYRDCERLAELTLARRALPNNPLVFELTGFINRRQGRWEESTNDLKRALSWTRGTSSCSTSCALLMNSCAVIEISLQFWIRRSN